MSFISFYLSIVVDLFPAKIAVTRLFERHT